MSANDLNEQQRLFCETYLQGYLNKRGTNATEAYMVAYPDSKKESAMANAARLLNHLNVKEYMRERLSSLVMGTNEVLIRLADLARNGEKDSDKLRALELIGRTQAMFLDRTDVTSQGKSISLADYLNGINDIQRSNTQKLPKEVTLLNLDEEER